MSLAFDRLSARYARIFRGSVVLRDGFVVAAYLASGGLIICPCRRSRVGLGDLRPDRRCRQFTLGARSCGTAIEIP